jgi:hypothetical protein
MSAGICSQFGTGACTGVLFYSVLAGGAHHTAFLQDDRNLYRNHGDFSGVGRIAGAEAWIFTDYHIGVRAYASEHRGA